MNLRRLLADRGGRQHTGSGRHGTCKRVAAVDACAILIGDLAAAFGTGNQCQAALLS